MGMIYFPVQEFANYISQQPVQPTGSSNIDFIVAFIAIPTLIVGLVFAMSWYKNRPKGPKQIEYVPREPEPKKAPEQAKPAGVV